MSKCLLDANEMAQNIILDYTDENGNLSEDMADSVIQYIDGDSIDFLDEITYRIDTEWIAEEVAIEIARLAKLE